MHRPKFPQLFDRPKLLVHRVTGKGGLRASVDLEGIYVNHSFDCIVRYGDLEDAPARARGSPAAVALSEEVSLDALACVLNSSLMAGYFRVKFGTDMDATPASLRALPLPPIESLRDDSALASLGSRIRSLTEDMREEALAQMNTLVEQAYDVNVAPSTS